MTGPAERELDRLGRRYAGVCRAVVAVGCGGLGLLLVPATHWPWAGLAVAVLIVWSGIYGWLILRTTASWPVVADVVLVCLLILAQAEVVPAASIVDGSGWVFALVSMTVVTYQWHTSLTVGVGASVILVGTYIASTQFQLNDVSVGWMSTSLWVIAEAFLSRGLIMLVRRGGRISDAYLAERERVQQAVALSRARRADELEYLADLHDTAAATFLMIGAGTVSGREPWLAEQARRDLRVLRADQPESRPREVVDLTAMLAGSLSEIELKVHYPAERTVRLPAAPAEAICDSVREALVNVQRHAGTGEATLSVTGAGQLPVDRREPIRPGAEVAGARLVVEIRDEGRGFDQARVSPHRRGIDESIRARMQRAGGRASITSAPGQGTTVRLEWPDG